MNIECAVFNFVPDLESIIDSFYSIILTGFHTQSLEDEMLKVVSKSCFHHHHHHHVFNMAVEGVPAIESAIFYGMTSSKISIETEFIFTLIFRTKFLF